MSRYILKSVDTGFITKFSFYWECAKCKSIMGTFGNRKIRIGAHTEGICALCDKAKLKQILAKEKSHRDKTVPI